MGKTVPLTFIWLVAVLVIGLQGCQVVLPQNQPLNDADDEDTEPMLTRALEPPPGTGTGQSIYLCHQYAPF
ncbi:hypothetical protein [Endozoicomonas sp. YOMI1]|uniref:hypothetical protein n=1 Tax=Endozoicomonas sp. YOMI1 TaxID=2828739 RepID=UPI0021483325|nr:hypothetical protein [Endozoicomonas sp. YOMI1]